MTGKLWVPLCGGINFIMALLAIILPLLYLTHSTWSRAVLFAAAVPPVALILKILLLGAVIALTPSLGQDKAVEYYHTWLGLPTFWLGVVGLIIPLFRTRHKGAFSNGEI